MGIPTVSTTNAKQLTTTIVSTTENTVPFPEDGDDLQTPEWVSDVTYEFVRLHVRDAATDSHLYTTHVICLRDESEDDAVVQSDVVVPLNKAQ